MAAGTVLGAFDTPFRSAVCFRHARTASEHGPGGNRGHSLIPLSGNAVLTLLYESRLLIPFAYSAHTE